AKNARGDRRGEPHPDPREHGVPWACLRGDAKVDRRGRYARGARLRARDLPLSVLQWRIALAGLPPFGLRLLGQYCRDEHAFLLWRASMGREFPLVPRDVPRVETAHRRTVTPIPAPASIARLEKLRQHEPTSMGGQPPIIWQEGEGVSIRDPYGNQWIDFSAGVLVASMGYGHPRVIEAMRKQLDTGLYHTYCFANGPRIELVKKLGSMVPPPLEKVFLLSTGSEATECAMKLAFTYAARAGRAVKPHLVTFENAFHGRTLGAQLAGGTPGLKDWIPGKHPEYVQVPFPDGFRTTDTSFDLF